MLSFLLLFLAAEVLRVSEAMGWNLADCPAMELDASPNLKGCAYKTFPLDRENDPNGATVNSFTRMLYSGDAPTAEALFLIEGGPGFSNHAFIPVADFLLSMNPAWTIYLQDHRGTGLSSPVNCAANPSVRNNISQESTACFHQLIFIIATHRHLTTLLLYSFTSTPTIPRSMWIAMIMWFLLLAMLWCTTTPTTRLGT